MRPTRILDYGDAALLAEFDSPAEVLAWTEALRSAPPAGVVDIVPAARTVLVTTTGPDRLGAVRRAVEPLTAPADDVLHHPDTVDVVIDVTYDGDDLADVADHTGLSVDEVVAAHTGTPWRVGFGGFAPGFAYLLGGDARLAVPRRSEPRTRVPAGSVALAGEFSGIYPREGPGGWQLIGRTDAVLWDLGRDEPALLRPGMWVAFRDTGRGRT
ncbi:allophanate hydrolase subunit 1 [Mycobacterium sp. MYCO198283]|uniref:5-oxoprolinase subunit B family protein n=1 Tax=Mycobacterium sp. MYCO198283 TaxID=2883505 RepID=UPI001E448C36|nr:allophanate hydrolase subunit 1 [Mycobacterium sp. MYCO198283]MCG5432054.1 allophanate hydrolase subunit 1 [Mycobacterium sp. MYCO198283]